MTAPGGIGPERLVIWWRGRRVGQARTVLAGLAAAAFGAGLLTGAAATARPGPPPDPTPVTLLGPMGVRLPEDPGPWEILPATGASADGVDGLWAARTGSGALLTVMTMPGADLSGVAAPPGSERAEWDGEGPGLAWRTGPGAVGEVVLVVGTEGGLVVLSVSGPTAEVDSVGIAGLVRTARVLD